MVTRKEAIEAATRLQQDDLPMLLANLTLNDVNTLIDYALKDA